MAHKYFCRLTHSGFETNVVPVPAVNIALQVFNPLMQNVCFKNISWYVDDTHYVNIRKIPPYHGFNFAVTLHDF